MDFAQLVRKGVDFESMRKMGRDVGALVGQTNYIDYKALGYDG